MGVGTLFTNIKNGKKGRNVGVSTGIPKLDRIIHGIQRKYLYTIGADTGKKFNILTFFNTLYLQIWFKS